MARSTSEISNSDVGQTSGQWVKPKKIRVGLPSRFLSVTVSPAWSVSWNGPPIAAGAGTPRTPPSVHNIRRSPITRLPAKAETITSGRAAVRSMLIFPSVRSETGRETGGDHLEEDRRPVLEPEPQRTQEQGGRLRASRNEVANSCGVENGGAMARF